MVPAIQGPVGPLIVPIQRGLGPDARGLTPNVSILLGEPVSLVA